MELKDEVVTDAPRAVVYAALNDPDVLRDCIPGCQELTRTSDTELRAKVILKVGPVKATFAGDVTLDPEDPPRRFSLAGQGNGGVAGFAKGGAAVTLEEDGDRTILRYDARAEIGGKMAQLGSRLVESTARTLAARFFADFAARVERRTEA